MLTIRFLAACVCLSGITWGQDFRATISGSVTDKTGAAIAGAVVRAVQRNTNEVKESKTDSSGFYALPFLQPSTFDLEVTANGFNKIRRTNVSLLVAEKLDLSFQLEVGNVTEQVTVSATAESLQTADASGGVNFDSLQTSEYPLNGRQVYMLMDLSPGVLFTQEQFGASGYSGTRGWDTSGAYVMNGGVQGTNSFSLNGAPISLTGTWQVAPNVDAIQEFKVQVNTYDSAVGRTGGGSVNTTLKSGSNQWHGTLFEFMRNQILDANYTQNNQVGAPRGKHITNQFGGTVGGAIRKDKDFVFFSFEGFRERVPFPVVADVPPLSIRDGQHFKDWGETIYDPLSQHPCQNNVGITGNCRSAPSVRNPFPGDVLPLNRISDIGKKILAFYPTPNIANQLTQNLVASNSTGKYNYNQPMGRWDRVIGEKDRIYALVTFQHGQEYRNQNGIQNDAAAGNIFSQRTSQNYIADWTRIVSPSAVLDVRASFGRFTSIFPDNAYTSSSLTAKDLGMTNMIHAPTSTTEFPPRFTFDQFSNIFGSGANLFTWGSEEQWNIAPTLTMTKGKKQWKIGFEFVYAMVPSGNVGRTNGQFTFDRSVTRQYPLVGGVNSSEGSSMADILLGQPASGLLDWNDTYYRTWPYYAGFVQNDWKIRRNITLNLGLRYDVQVPWVERWDRANTGFDFNVKNPLSDQIIAAWTANKIAYDKNKPTYPYPAVPAAIYGGKTFIQPGGSRRTYNTDYSDIQPRVGLAWQFAPKTVLRTGGGIYHRTATQTGYTDGFSQQTVYNATPDSGITYPGLSNPGGAFSLVNPFPNGIISPSGRDLGLLTNVGNGINYDGAQRVIPRTFQYSFGLQRDFMYGINIDASYVGSYTNKVPMPYNSDYLSYDTFLQGQKTPASLSTSVPNPFYGIIPKTATFGASSTITIQNLSYPYPLFNGITVQTNPWGYYRYDSLQLRVQKRFGGDRSQGGALTTIFSYTFSKNMQSVNRLQNWNLNETPVHELVSYDKPQNIAFSGVWDLPVGKRRHFFNNPNMVVDKLISGWNMNWIYRYTSGIPVGGIDAVFSCPTYLVDNQVHDQWFNNTKSCYKGRASFTLRTAPDRFPWLRQMDNLNMNLAVAKDFRLPFENMTFNLRGEAFNLMNHPLYGAPDTGYTNARFGMLPVGQQNFPRLVQVSMKIRF